MRLLNKPKPNRLNIKPNIGKLPQVVLKRALEEYFWKKVIQPPAGLLNRFIWRVLTFRQWLRLGGPNLKNYARYTNKMAILRKPKIKEFAQISNNVTQNERLSWKARGIICYLLSKPEGWKVQFSDLLKASKKDGKDSLKAGLKELETEGFLVWTTARGEGGKFESVLDIFEESLPPAVRGTNTRGPLAFVAESGFSAFQENLSSTYGYLYLVECDGVYKIGITSDINKRMVVLKTNNPKPINLLISFEHSNAYKLEQEILNKYNAYKQTGEWLNLPTKEAAKLLKELKSMADFPPEADFPQSLDSDKNGESLDFIEENENLGNNGMAENPPEAENPQRLENEPKRINGIGKPATDNKRNVLNTELTNTEEITNVISNLSEKHKENFLSTLNQNQISDLRKAICRLSYQKRGAIKTINETEWNQITELFSYWVDFWDLTKGTKLTPERGRAILDRLRSSVVWTVEDIKTGILGNSKSPHHNGANDRGGVYHDIELICRTDQHLAVAIGHAEAALELENNKNYDTRNKGTGTGARNAKNSKGIQPSGGNNLEDEEAAFRRIGAIPNRD